MAHISIFIGGMAGYRTADIHNVLLAGLRSGGKTTLAEALLFRAGEINRKGTVESGTCASDFEKEERDHHHSVYSALLHVTHQGKRINILDLPGAPDLNTFWSNIIDRLD
ncbi:MAG: GTP-binding protein, partial [Deltaproteobacteria bacterium]|nr:GTP-binding protein [Deltaproteobacteria bacterium]